MMKKLFLILLSSFVHAQNSMDLFTQAADRYKKNEWTQALALYNQIPHKGASTWYNMGNCVYKLNDHLKALLYWKRAYQQGNSHIKNDSFKNMQLLPFAQAYLSNSYLNVPAWLMQLLFFFIFSIFLIIGYFLIRAKQWIFLLLSISVIVAAGRITYQVSSSPRQALIMQENALFRAGPGIEFHQVHTAPAGTMLTLVKESDGWAQVMIDDIRGWVENKQIEKI